jgi:hypothetical protein
VEMLYLVIFFIVLTILIVAIIIVLFIKARILLEYLRDGYDDHFIISLHILGELISYKYEIPLIDLEKNGIKIRKFKEKRDIKEDEEKVERKINFFSFIEKVKTVIETKNRNNDIICEIREYLSGKLVMEDLRLKVEIGTGDAFYTGIASGLVWGVVGILSSYLLNNVKNIEKNIEVKSDFNSMKLNVDLHSIFSIRVVHIIVVRLKIAKIKKRDVKSKETIGGGVSG